MVLVEREFGSNDYLIILLTIHEAFGFALRLDQSIPCKHIQVGHTVEISPT